MKRIWGQNQKLPAKNNDEKSRNNISLIWSQTFWKLLVKQSKTINSETHQTGTVYGRRIWCISTIILKIVKLQLTTKYFLRYERQEYLVTYYSDYAMLSIKKILKWNGLEAEFLPIAGVRIIGFIPFPRVLVLCEMQSVQDLNSCRRAHFLRR